jgi:hypothetical protein
MENVPLLALRASSFVFQPSLAPGTALAGAERDDEGNPITGAGISGRRPIRGRMVGIV